MAEKPSEEKGATGEPEGEQPKKKGGLVKLIVIIAVALLFVVAALWGGMWVYQILSSLFSGGEGLEAVAGAEAAEGINPLDLDNPPGLLVFDMPFLIRLNRGESVLAGECYLKIKVSFEVESEAIQGAMEGQLVVMSRIKDNITTFFSSQFPSDVEASNWPLVKQQLLSRINTQLPEQYQLQRVNFEEFLVQPR